MMYSNDYCCYCDAYLYYTWVVCLLEACLLKDYMVAIIVESGDGEAAASRNLGAA